MNDYSIKLRLIADRITSVAHSAQRIPLLPNNVKADMLRHGKADAAFLNELADYLESSKRVPND